MKSSHRFRKRPPPWTLFRWQVYCHDNAVSVPLNISTYLHSSHLLMSALTHSELLQNRTILHISSFTYILIAIADFPALDWLIFLCTSNHWVSGAPFFEPIQFSSFFVLRCDRATVALEDHKCLCGSRTWIICGHCSASHKLLSDKALLGAVVNSSALSIGTWESIASVWCHDMDHGSISTVRMVEIEATQSSGKSASSCYVWRDEGTNVRRLIEAPQTLFISSLFIVLH